MTKRRFKSQPRIPGLTRTPSYASVLPDVDKRVEKDAAAYGVSKSWVRATILAEFYNIDAPDFRKDVIVKRKK